MTFIRNLDLMHAVRLSIDNVFNAAPNRTVPGANATPTTYGSLERLI